MINIIRVGGFFIVRVFRLSKNSIKNKNNILFVYVYCINKGLIDFLSFFYYQPTDVFKN